MRSRGTTNHIDLARAFGLQERPAQILKVLLSRPAVLPGELERRARIPRGYAKVIVSRLRNQLGRRAKICSKRGCGYWIEPAHKKRLRAAVTQHLA